MAPVDACAVGSLLDGELPGLAEAADVGRNTDAQVMLGQLGGHGATLERGRRAQHAKFGA